MTGLSAISLFIQLINKIADNDGFGELATRLAHPLSFGLIVGTTTLIQVLGLGHASVKTNSTSRSPPTFHPTKDLNNSELSHNLN